MTVNKPDTIPVPRETLQGWIEAMQTWSESDKQQALSEMREMVK